MSDIHALSGAYAVDAVDDLERAELRTAPGGVRRVPRRGGQPQGGRRRAGRRRADPAAARAARRRARRHQPGPPAARRSPPHETADRDCDWARPSPDGGAGSPALVAAAVLAVIGAGLAVAQPWRDDSSTTQSAAEQVLGDPDAQRVTQELPVGGTATVVRSPTYHQTVVVTKDVPAPPDGKTYQMWLQDPSQTMVSAGLMPAGENTYLLKGNSDDALAAGLSLEPEGGSSQPTDVVALFDFSKSS